MVCDNEEKLLNLMQFSDHQLPGPNISEQKLTLGDLKSIITIGG
jgi:hypothetical protein